MDSNLSQYCIWLFSWTLYQLSYHPPTHPPPPIPVKIVVTIGMCIILFSSQMKGNLLVTQGKHILFVFLFLSNICKKVHVKIYHIRSLKICFNFGHRLGTRLTSQPSTPFFLCVVSKLNILKTHFQCMLGYFGVSMIHQTLTWSTGSLTRVCNIFCKHIMHMGDLSL